MIARTHASLGELIAASFDAAALIGKTKSQTTRLATAAVTDVLRRITESTTLRGPRRISLAGAR